MFVHLFQIQEEKPLQSMEETPTKKISPSTTKKKTTFQPKDAIKRNQQQQQQQHQPLISSEAFRKSSEQIKQTLETKLRLGMPGMGRSKSVPEARPSPSIQLESRAGGKDQSTSLESISFKEENVQSPSPHTDESKAVSSTKEFSMEIEIRNDLPMSLGPRLTSVSIAGMIFQIFRYGSQRFFYSSSIFLTLMFSWFAATTDYRSKRKKNPFQRPSYRKTKQDRIL
jgi:hypothetical protein